MIGEINRSLQNHDNNDNAILYILEIIKKKFFSFTSLSFSLVHLITQNAELYQIYKQYNIFLKYYVDMYVYCCWKGKFTLNNYFDHGLCHKGIYLKMRLRLCKCLKHLRDATHMYAHRLNNYWPLVSLAAFSFTCNIYRDQIYTRFE